MIIYAWKMCEYVKYVHNMWGIYRLSLGNVENGYSLVNHKDEFGKKMMFERTLLKRLCDKCRDICDTIIHTCL